MSNVRFDSHVTAHGLTLIGEYHEHAVSTSLMYVVNAGSRDETPDISGVSHFLEHMAFKGNEQYSADDLNRLFDEIGANYNAFTRVDATAYYGSVVQSRAEEFLTLLSQLLKPSLRESDFEVEKNVILEEIAMYQDRPEMHLYDQSRERFWNGHGLGNSVLGTTESITALTSAQMRDYFQRRYSTKNMLFVITGKYDWDAIVRMVTDLTSDFATAPITRAYRPASVQTGAFHETQTRLKRTHMMTWYEAPKQPSTVNYTLPLLVSLIGGSDNSRLYWELVATGLAEDAALYVDQTPDNGTFYGFLDSAPEDAQAVLHAYRAVLETAQTDGLSQKEWEHVRRKYAAVTTMAAETPQGRLRTLAFSFLKWQRYVSLDEQLDRIMSASLDEANAFLASRPFDDEFLMTLGPRDPQFSSLQRVRY